MTPTYPYPEVTDELLSKAVSCILAVGNPLKIVLFGSRARGEAKPDSDLDLLVIEDPTYPVTNGLGAIGRRFWVSFQRYRRLDAAGSQRVAVC